MAEGPHGTWPTRQLDFDERLWPVNCALLMLAAFVAGIVVATSSFDDPRLLYNGWGRLAGVAMLMVVLFVGMLCFQGNAARRLQLSVLVSVLIHLTIIASLPAAKLLPSGRLAVLPNQQPADALETEPISDFHWQQAEEPAQTAEPSIFEAPATAEVPQGSEPKTDSAYQSPGQMLADEKMIGPSELTSAPQPEPVEIRRVQSPAPEPVDVAAGGPIDRQRPQEVAQPDEPIPAPEIESTATQSAGTLSASQTAVVEQQNVAAAAHRESTSPESESSQPRTAIPPARRDAASTRPDTLTAPAVPAEVAPVAKVAAAELPPAEVDVPASPDVLPSPQPAQPWPLPPHLAPTTPQPAGLPSLATAPSTTVDVLAPPPAAAVASVSRPSGSAGLQPRQLAGPVSPLSTLVPIPVQRASRGSPADFAVDPTEIALTAAVDNAAGRDTHPPAFDGPSDFGSGIGRQQSGLPMRSATVAVGGRADSHAPPQIDLLGRRAWPETELVYNDARPNALPRTGRDAALDSSASESTPSYEQRDPGRRSRTAQMHGGGGVTEKAVEVGLEFFARIQFPDGHWSLHRLPDGFRVEDPALGQMESDTAATGLALLTYLGAGYTHLDEKYRKVVGGGVGWLVRQQQPNGDLFVGGSQFARFYSHGIAAMALCEAYGMTQDPALREPARKAVAFIIDTQHPTHGGWRYEISPATGRSSESDTSVTGWQLMALRSAQMAGLDVPAEVFDRVGHWLDVAQAQAAGGRYVYNPYADRNRPEQLAGLGPSLAMTSEAMLMRMYLGQKRDDPRLIEGAEYLKANLPGLGTPQRPQRDCYYWYYATQAMFQMQGDYWPAWNERMRQAIAASQVPAGKLAGSWHPTQPVPDRWGQAGGRVYVTAMHLLMFEVYYRHLPLFQELGK